MRTDDSWQVHVQYDLLMERGDIGYQEGARRFTVFVGAFNGLTMSALQAQAEDRRTNLRFAGPFDVAESTDHINAELSSRIAELIHDLQILDQGRQSFRLPDEDTERYLASLLTESLKTRTLLPVFGSPPVDWTTLAHGLGTSGASLAFITLSHPGLAVTVIVAGGNAFYVLIAAPVIKSAVRGITGVMDDYFEDARLRLREQREKSRSGRYDASTNTEAG